MRIPLSSPSEQRVAQHRSALVALCAAVSLIVGGSVTLASGRPLDAGVPVPSSAFSAEQIRHGRALASIGNCQGCHTQPGGAAFAGGVALKSPFGTIYGSNITPDPDTGIGRWSLASFERAMRDGVGRDGEQLYPAFPYDHFTQLTDDDIASLYAFVMTRVPVRAVPPPNRLVFPLQFRPLIAGWKVLYFRKGDAGRAPPADRGAYLVDALGHCGACHSPRNALGAEQHSGDGAFSGGEVDGWYAPALDGRSPSPVPWSVAPLEQYLESGIADEHAIAGGPMQGVIHEMAWADPADVHAMAERVVSMMGSPSPAAVERAATSRLLATDGGWAVPRMRSGATLDTATAALGATVYAGACASCHDQGRGVSSNAALQMPLAIAVHDPDPRSLIRIVRFGIVPPAGEARRFMPAFDGTLTDAQIVALLAFLRQQAAQAAPWPDLATAVRDSHDTPGP